MAFIPAENTVRVALHFSQAGQQVENVFHVQNTDPWNATTMGELAATVRSWWIDDLQETTAPNVSLNEITVKDLTTEGGLEIVYTTGLPELGISSSAPMPNNVTIAIKLLTALGGRSHRGRQYIVGLTTGNVTADRNHLEALALTLYQDAYNDLISDLNSVYTPGMVIASFVSGGVPRVEAELTEVTNAGFSDNILDSQRRRLPGRGN